MDFEGEEVLKFNRFYPILCSCVDTARFPGLSERSPASPRHAYGMPRDTTFMQAQLVSAHIPPLVDSGSPAQREKSLSLVSH